MTDANLTWAVVATMDEPPALVQGFVAWHLWIGAQAVYLYFDRPDDPAAALFDHLPQVHVTCCDTAYWQGERPGRHEVRQVKNARDAYTRATTTWLAHIDADEFIWGDVAAGLSAVMQPTHCVTLPVAERVYVGDVAGQTLFDGAFRRPFRAPADIGRAVFGPDYDLTNRGLTGHAQGKAFSRVGADLRLSIHRPKPARGAGELQIMHADPTQFELLHFEGLTPAHWVFKLKRMAHALANHDGMPPSKHRAQQIAALHDDPAGARALHDRLKVIAPDDVQALRDHGLLIAPDFDLADALAVYFPQTPVDLSAGSFDAWIAANKATVLRHLTDRSPKGP